MLLTILFDFPAFFLIFSFVGLLLAVILNIVIVLIERERLFRLDYGSKQQSFYAAFTMNIASALIGFFSVELEAFEYWPVVMPINGVVRFVGEGGEYPGIGAVVWFFVISFVFSVLIEGLVLLLLGRELGHSKSTLWRMTVMANVSSYIFLVALFSVAAVFIFFFRF